MFLTKNTLMFLTVTATALAAETGTAPWLTVSILAKSIGSLQYHVTGEKPSLRALGETRRKIEEAKSFSYVHVYVSPVATPQRTLNNLMAEPNATNCNVITFMYKKQYDKEIESISFPPPSRDIEVTPYFVEGETSEGDEENKSQQDGPAVVALTDRDCLTKRSGNSTGFFSGLSNFLVVSARDRIANEIINGLQPTKSESEGISQAQPEAVPEEIPEIIPAAAPPEAFPEEIPAAAMPQPLPVEFSEEIPEEIPAVHGG